MIQHVTSEASSYMTAGQAAERYSFNRDYIARLCRENRVLSRRVGRLWYVQEDSLLDFIAAQAQANDDRRKRLAQKGIREYYGSAATAAIDMAQTGVEKLDSIAKPLVSHARAMHSVVKELSAPHAESLVRAAHYAGTPYTATEGLLKSVHVPMQHISPITELLHKITALAFACMLTFAAYSVVDPTYARYTAVELTKMAAAVSQSIKSEFLPAK